MTPRRTILAGALLALAGAAIAFAGAGLAGPKNPSCKFLTCLGLATLVQLVGLLVALAGGILVAIGLGRRWSDAENVESGEPPSRP